MGVRSDNILDAVKTDKVFDITTLSKIHVSFLVYFMTYMMKKVEQDIVLLPQNLRIQAKQKNS